MGGVARDDRGEVSFVNSFDFKDVKRFYVVKNKKKGQFRGWHGHKKESKYIFAVCGIALIACVKIDNWENPSKKLKINKFKVSAEEPSIVYIPPGYANGFKNLTKDTKLIFYSGATLKESEKDDFRFPKDYWTIK